MQNQSQTIYEIPAGRCGEREGERLAAEFMGVHLFIYVRA